MELRTAIGLRPVSSGEPIGPMINLIPCPAMLLAAAAAPSAVYLLSIATVEVRQVSPFTLIIPALLASAATNSAAPRSAIPHCAAGPDNTPMTPSLSSQSAAAGVAYTTVTAAVAAATDTNIDRWILLMWLLPGEGFR